MELALAEPRGEELTMPPRRIEPTTEVDDLKAEIAELKIAMARRPRTDWNRTIQFGIAALSFSALIFSAGGWWKRTDNIESRLSVLEDVVKTVVKTQSDQKTDSALQSAQINQMLTIVSKIEGATVVAPRNR